jgi:hypothetical protein
MKLDNREVLKNARDFKERFEKDADKVAKAVLGLLDSREKNPTTDKGSCLDEETKTSDCSRCKYFDECFELCGFVKCKGFQARLPDETKLVDCDFESGRNDDGTRICKYIPNPCAAKNPKKCYLTLGAIAKAYQVRKS